VHDSVALAYVLFYFFSLTSVRVMVVVVARQVHATVRGGRSTVEDNGYGTITSVPSMP